jgi:cytochrome c556
MKSSIFVAVTSVLSLATFSVSGIAQETATEAQKTENDRTFYELLTIEEDPVGYRRQVKQALQSHMAAYGLILIAKAPHPEHAPAHADAIAALGAQHMVLYPQGSDTDATRPEIWSQTERFADMLQHLADATAYLKEKQDTGNRHQMLNALTRLGESCEGCHNRYRIEAE